MRRMTAVLFALLTLPAGAWAARYQIDPGHSTVGFKVRHLVISKVAGRFNKFSGEVSYDPKDPKSWSAKAVIDAASIDTGVADRDDHLRNPDFLDVRKHPTIEFATKGVEGVKGNRAKLQGELTMHGVTKPVTLDLEINGVGKGMHGEERAAFTATTKINRKDYGVSWNRILETGGLAVGEDVEIVIEIEAVRK